MSSLFFSPTRWAILTMSTLGSSFSKSICRHTRRSTNPLGCNPLVDDFVPYPTLTLWGQPLSSLRILLVTPRGLRQFSFTLLYRQLSWRLNAGLASVIYHHFTCFSVVCGVPFPEMYIPSRKTRRSFFLIFVLS